VSDGDAREQMIAAAERLAATEGLGAMSLRSVQAASGQRNKSAAQYHFGSREGLIEAVVDARMGPVNERRLELLADLDARREQPSLRDLATALVVPLAEHTVASPGSHWARFLAQGLADPVLSAVVRRNFEGRSYRVVRTRAAAALDHLPPAQRERRLDHAVGLVVMSLAATESQLEVTGSAPLPLADMVADLVEICTAVLAAPAVAPTGAPVGTSTGETIAHP
jgi:AcrR family transcriptional regulator